MKHSATRNVRMNFWGLRLASKEKTQAVFMAYLRVEGRITIPKELRDAYNLKEGDLVECQIRKIK